MIRQAESGDEATLDTFLRRHAETSMYLRGNLAAHGIGLSDHDHASEFLLDETADGLRNVFGRTNCGYLMIQAPAPNPDFWRTVRNFVQGRAYHGITGTAWQVAQALDHLGLNEQTYTMLEDEPLYRLNLSKLKQTDGRIRPPSEDDLPLLAKWFAGYLTDTRQSPDRTHARATALAKARDALRAGNTRILLDADRPVAMTSFSAVLPDMVQVGGVYVHPTERDRGLGRNAVALHLNEARRDGVTKAVLFANNPAAARAYEGIGFERIGDYRIALLSDPVRLERT